MFAKLGALVDRYRWPVVAGWLVLVVCGGVFGGGLFDRLETTTTNRSDSESAVAQDTIDRIAPQGSIVIAVIEGRDVYDGGLNASVSKAANEIRAMTGVKEVNDLYTGQGGQVGADNMSTTVRVELDPRLNDADREALEDRVRDRLEMIEAPSVVVGGDKIAERAFAEQSVDDLAIGESVAFVALLVALVLIFGGVVAASLPLAVAVAGVTGSLLLLLGLSYVTKVSEYSLNVVTLLGIGLAVDYSLLIVARFREERRTHEPGDALVVAVERSGRAVLISGVAVALTLGGLAVFAEPLLAAVALGGAAVVVLATLAALTLVPALLSFAKHRIKASAEPKRNLLARLATKAQEKPGPVALAVVAGLLVLAAPLLGANFANSDARALPHSNEARQAYDALQTKFNNNHPDDVVVLVEAGSERADVRMFMNQINQLQQDLFRLEVRRDVPKGWTVLDLTPKGEVGGAESYDLVRKVRAVATPFPKYVTGSAAEVVDYRQSLAGRLPLAALIVLLVTVVLLFALTGSVVIPLKAVLMNLLTLLATLGVLVAVFQWGWGQLPLFFDSWGGVDLTTPVLLFVFIFGLSMDYEVFLLARIKEEYDLRPDTNRAVLRGITRSGPVVTAAAICIGIVFLGFTFGGLVAVKEIGVGMTVAVLIDVTVVRGLLLPALMTMLDNWNWWAPKFAQRRRAAVRV
ncbi:MMPL family transporter [Dactylosporangium sp. AC04546]|uniref:MMPL family transporter n=1 Tax=Dactylosporangium sp. AC04546 TaxID=2862460 RepID=UPI001EE0BFD1|nr:MMPL family transporter [Dactylosporangium sp. AC04546]WVK83913.1 MMPL family transporter [Dactylosporangium sp. AC04546]